MSSDSRANRVVDPARVVDRILALRPQLPDADRLLPYLRRIDATRIYTNWGPLSGELEQRLDRQFGLEAGSVVSAASGTTALIGAILAVAGRAVRERPLAILPAWTFVATASAVEQCGYRPYLVDVDPGTWVIDPNALADHPMLNRVGLVVPVATFGRTVRQAEWLAFRRRTGIPVVIDGAAAFEAIASEPGGLAGEVPVAVSFHATKTFATGEGGCVVTTDRRLAKRVTESLNFGFFDSRDSRGPSTNGKMSEYHAAVGLAELDGWVEKRAAFADVARRYRTMFNEVRLAERLITAPEVAGCYALFHCSEDEDALRVRDELGRSGIESRAWYGAGLLAQPYLDDVPHDSLVVTDSLAARLIGLPIALDLFDQAIARVAAAMPDALKNARPCRALQS